MNKWILILALLLLAPKGHASFSENSRRYLSPKDMFAVLAQKFPVITDKNFVSRFNFPGNLVPISCWAVGVRNGNATGLVLPAIGAPATNKPGAAFVRWWGTCGDMIIRKQFDWLQSKANDEKLWQKYYSPDMLDQYRDKSDSANPFHQLDKIEWQSLKPRQKQAHVRYLIEEMIGPNAVIADLGFAKGIDDLATTIRSQMPEDSTLTLNQATQKLLTGVILREEFITY